MTRAWMALAGIAVGGALVVDVNAGPPAARTALLCIAGVLAAPAGLRALVAGDTGRAAPDLEDTAPQHQPSPRPVA